MPAWARRKTWRWVSRTAGIALFLAPTLIAAQERVSIRPTPVPGAVIHVTTRQEVLLRVGANPEEPGPAYLHNKNSVSFTQTNGAFAADGTLQAQLAIERLELDESLAGNPRKLEDPSALTGRILVVTLDRTGKLLAIKVPPDMRAFSARLTQLLAGAYGIVNFLPPVELHVGGQTTQTSDLPMRLPGNVAAGPLQAQTTLTMQALEKPGKDRIARLQQAVEVATSTSLVQVTGGGNIAVNVDRGFVSGADTEWKIAGTLPASAGATAPPFFGSIKVSVSAN